MQADSSARYGVPGATYRLQLTPDFGFAEAAEVVPYLARLGVSHVYLSPFFEAVAGSQHGYDVTDHSQVRKELGGLGGLHALGEALIAHGLGLIADFVPNHVGIGAGNAWWADVLRYGRESPYAQYFDIDWEAQPQMERGVLWYPLLGQPFGRALESGEIQLELRDFEPVVTYYDHSIPLSPGTYPRVLGIPPAGAAGGSSNPAAAAQLAETLDELRASPREQSEVLRSRLRDILAGEWRLHEWAAGRAQAFNGTPGDSASFDPMETLLLDQHYRLADWRVSGEEINYRRFFDQNGLAAIRVERDDVFEAIHALLFELVAAGIVTGVRLDHVDGLYDPGSYLARLRQRLDGAAAHLGHVPIFVEKVLGPGESLPPWSIEGTTGYDFLGAVGDLMVDPRGMRDLETQYRRFTGDRQGFPDAAYAAKAHITAAAFSGELNVLAWQLYRLGQRHRLHRDNTLRSLRRAIAGVLASFPVYRTYVGDDPEDGWNHIAHAMHEAARRDHTLSPAALAFLEEVLSLRGELDDDERSRRLHFRRRFQQLSGPIMAKGVEDTAFYRFVPLLSQNEVGASPGARMTVTDVQRWFEERASTWPASMSASSTHDTKRSEDARARLAVLPEMPTAWRQEVSVWSRMNERHRAPEASHVPPAVTEWYLYQTLLASWPSGGPDAEYTERICGHMLKAIREAKIETSWLRPDTAYEEAVLAFVRRILAPRGASAFQRRLNRFSERISEAAELNSLAMLTLKCLSPGVPDFYQGTEVPSFSLTDPDNRRPVDFPRLARMLAAVDGRATPEAAPERKLWLTQRLLAIRRDHAVARCGRYVPLAVSGPRADNVVAFARESDIETMVVVVPRLAHSLASTADRWTGTTVESPGRSWTNLLTGMSGSSSECAVLFDRFPIAVLSMEDLR